jgi:hypothetical protein
LGMVGLEIVAVAGPARRRIPMVRTIRDIA